MNHQSTIPPEDENMATPPYFKSWRSIYMLVLILLVVIIVSLYLFTRSYAVV